MYNGNLKKEDGPPLPTCKKMPILATFDKIKENGPFKRVLDTF